MATNLTPQYHRAEEEYRRAATAEDEVKWLEVMLREMPKHKASEKLQSDVKQKLARARKELEQERKVGGTRGHGVRIPRQGAGTGVILGGPNGGKSQLLSVLTRATPTIAPYPFTTQAPLPGMMLFEDVLVQLIDTPPITPDFFETYMQGLIRGADLALLVVDLATDDGLEQAQAVFERLAATKTRLGATSHLDEDDIGISFTQTRLIFNKIDLPGAAERAALFRELYPHELPEHRASATTGVGLDELRAAVYKALGVIRVYTKRPGAKDVGLDRPFTLPRGGTVLDVARLVHKDLAEKFKFGKLWGAGVHDGTQVKGDHVLSDRDVLELHTS